MALQELPLPVVHLAQPGGEKSALSGALDLLLVFTSCADGHCQPGRASACAGRALMRVPYWEHLLGLVERGCLEADFHTASEPALVQAHADLATYLATILVGLFDPARLALLRPGHCLPRSTTSLMWQPTCPPTPTPRPVVSSALPGEVNRTPQRLLFACVWLACASPSQLPRACVARLLPHSRWPWSLWSSTRRRPVRWTSSMPVGSSSIPSACRRPLSTGFRGDSAPGLV